MRNTLTEENSHLLLPLNDDGGDEGDEAFSWSRSNIANHVADDHYQQLKEEDEEEALLRKNEWPSVNCPQVQNSTLPEPYTRLLRLVGFMPFKDAASRSPPTHLDLAFSVVRMALLPLLCVGVIFMVTLRWFTELRGERFVEVPRPSMDTMDKVFFQGRNVLLVLDALFFVCLEIRFCHNRGLHIPMALVDDPATRRKMCRWHFGFIFIATCIATAILEGLIITDMAKPTESAGVGRVVIGMSMIFCCVAVLSFYVATALDVFLFMCHAHIEAARLFKRKLIRAYNSKRAAHAQPRHMHDLISGHGQLISAVQASSHAWKGIIACSLPLFTISVLHSVIIISTDMGTHFEVPMIFTLGVLMAGMVYQLVLVGIANQSIVEKANTLYLNHKYLQEDEAKASFLDQLNTLMAYLTSSNPYWNCLVDVTPDKAAIVVSLLLSLATYILPFLKDLYIPKS